MENEIEIKLDKLSRAILVVLQKDPRASYSDIGKVVGLSAPAVAQRISKMEEAEVIKGYQTLIDYKKFGYGHVAIITFTADRGKSEAFNAHIRQIPEVLECHHVTGRFCIFIKVVYRDPEHLEQIVKDFSRFGETTTSIILSSIVENRILN